MAIFKYVKVCFMNIIDKRIDEGKPFDWGRTSADYAKYRDIYPQEFYDKILGRGLCKDGQSVLDIGTGTGVIPRNMYRYGAKWTGTDISHGQIESAKKLSKGMDIEYYAISTEKLDFPEASFDVITACQCFWYFDHEKVSPMLRKMLRADGRFLLLYMAWLPFEDRIAGESEKLILKYSPNWSGAREKIRPIDIPPCYLRDFELVHSEEYLLSVPFTRDSWHGRVKASRGIGASLSDVEIESFEAQHRELLRKIAPERFEVLHYSAIAELKRL